MGRPGWPFTCGDPGLCGGEGTGGGAPQRESVFSSTSHTCPEEGAREPARRRGCEAGPPSKSSEVTAHEDETQKEPESERITRYQTGESTEQSPRHAGSAGRRGEGPPRDGRLRRAATHSAPWGHGTGQGREGPEVRCQGSGGLIDRGDLGTKAPLEGTHAQRGTGHGPSGRREDKANRSKKLRNDEKDQ